MTGHGSEAQVLKGFLLVLRDPPRTNQKPLSYVKLVRSDRSGVIAVSKSLFGFESGRIERVERGR